jgi:[DsrC]-trisulfide reductase subunit M
MSILLSLVAVIVLALVSFFGVSAGLDGVFGIALPYAAFLVFVVGFIYRIVIWAKAPVPFRIPTTCGQQKALDWIPSSKLDNPHTKCGVVGRMLLEVLLFRSLFRNSKAEVRSGPVPKLSYGTSIWLWLGALVFHWAFLVVVIRHLRLVTNPVPWCLGLLENVDGMLQITLPVLYMSTVAFLAGLLFLIARRLFNPQVRYISLLTDWFPLFLILGIGFTGVWMRHLGGRADISGVKDLTLGLATFSPTVPQGLSGIFYVHIFLVSVLLAYFPFSKLMHLGGVFLSPTRNLANTNRMVRHINPWNADVRVHTYLEWQEEFRKEVEEAGYPLEGE